MKKKKIAILLSGNIRIHEENRKCLINFFRDFEITIFATIWNNQKNINEFVQYYQINNYNLIELKNWESTLSKVKYVTGEENRSFKIENIFHMWLSISESTKFLQKQVKEKKLIFDYVCRFRSDLIIKTSSNYIKDQIIKLKKNQILVPCSNHFKGVNDRFFITSYSTYLKFENIMFFIEKFITYKPLNPEYLFYCFIKNYKMKIILMNNLNEKILAQHTKTHENYELKPTKNVHVPLMDKISMKKIKYEIKIKKFLLNIKLY